MKAYTSISFLAMFLEIATYITTKFSKKKSSLLIILEALLHVSVPHQVHLANGLICSAELSKHLF